MVLGLGQRRPAAAPPAEPPTRASRLDVVLAWGAMAPFLASAAIAWLTLGQIQALAMSVAIIWGGAMLAFLAGVRRGLGFGATASPQPRQIVLTLWTFVLAFGSMIALRPLTSLGLLILGYASLAVLARAPAARAEVPLFFAHLRPLQMSVAALSLCAIAARLVMQA